MSLYTLVKYFKFAQKHYKDLEHPVYVATQFLGVEEIIVGLFHDILEDTDLTEEELLNFLKEENMEHLFEDIKILTRDASDTYFEYIQKVKKHGGIALEIKKSDLKHHLERKETLKPSLEKRYKKAIKILKE